MNKVLKSLAVCGLGLVMLPGMVKADLNGEQTLGSYSGSAKLNNIDNGERFELALTWGELSYDFVKQENGSYAWVPVNTVDEYSGESTSSNFINLINLSTTQVAATVSWNTNITGVNANFDLSSSQCNIENEQNPYGWNEQDVSVNASYSTTNGATYYTDSNCSTEVTEGTEYMSDQYYYKAPVNGLGGYDSSYVLMPAFGNRISSNITWNVNLEGGELANVKIISKTTDKVIGTFTVNIEDGSDIQGDIG